MYTTIFNKHAQLLKALAHPKRLEIIQLLRDRDLCVSDIQKMLGLPQPNISQHLQRLRSAGVVRAHRSGKQLTYRIMHPNFVIASDALRTILIDRAATKRQADEISLSMNELVPLVIDPVCGMRISPKTASCVHIHEGKPYYFCATGCMKQFKKNPTVA